jgi:hypothetical protein
VINGNANGTQVANFSSNVKVNGNAGATPTIAICGVQLTPPANKVNVSKGCS